MARNMGLRQQDRGAQPINWVTSMAMAVLAFVILAELQVISKYIWVLWKT